MLTHFVKKGRRLFFPPRYEDRHEDFRRVLLNAINVGLRVAGGLALVAVAVYLLGKIGIGGASPRWTIAPSLPPDEVLVLDKVLIVALGRSEERRVGKECASMCRSRWSPYH